MNNALSPKYAPCVRPLTIVRDVIDLDTGELATTKFEKRCGTRRRDLCSGCSVQWRDDAYHALMNGALGHSGPITFITLTAPGAQTFGKTHTAQHKNKFSERCACRRFHTPTDVIVGLPVNPKEFNHRQIVEFNNAAPRLLTITTQKIWRLMAADAQMTLREVKLPVARVMEWQERGVLHTHLIVLGFVQSSYVQWAVNGRPKAGGHRRINRTEHKGIHWGSQVNVQHINGGDVTQLKKLSSYAIKLVNYALKDVASDEMEHRQGHQTYRRTLRSHTNSVIKCEKVSSVCSASLHASSFTPTRRRKNFCVRHRRGYHQLGFTGNVLSLNRRWGTTLGAARKQRQAFASHSAPALCLDKEKKLVTHRVLPRVLGGQKQILANLIGSQTVSLSGALSPPLT